MNDHRTNNNYCKRLKEEAIWVSFYWKACRGHGKMYSLFYFIF